MLSKKQKLILKGKVEVEDSYKRKVRSEAFSKAQDAVDDLLVLATKFPEQSLERVFPPEKVAKLVNTLLEVKLERLKTKRLPPSMGRKRPLRRKTFIQLAGVWRKSDGSLLKRPDLKRRLILAHSILSAIHQSLSQLSELKHSQQVLRLERDGQEVKLSVSGFKLHSRKTNRYNFQSKEVEETTQQLVTFRIGDKDPKNILIIVMPR